MLSYVVGTVDHGIIKVPEYPRVVLLQVCKESRDDRFGKHGGILIFFN